MANRSLGSLTLDLIAKTAGFERGMDRASSVTKKRMAEIEKNAKAAGVVIGTALVAGTTAIAVQVQKSINDMDNLAKAAQRVGISVEELSALEFAGNLAGVTNMETGLKSLNRALGNAAAGSKEVQDVFDGLGIQVLDTNGNLRNTLDVMRDLADRFKVLPDGPEKTFAAVKLRIQDLIPLLNSGSEGIREAMEEAERFGLVVGTDAAKAAEVFNDNLSRLWSVADGFGRQLAAELLPDLVFLTNELVKMAGPGGLAASVASGIRDMATGALLLAEGLRAVAGHAEIAFGRMNKLGAIASGSPSAIVAAFSGSNDALIASGQARQAEAAANAQAILDGRARMEAGGSTTGPSGRSGRGATRKAIEEERERASVVKELTDRLAAARTEDERAKAAREAAGKAAKEAAEEERRRAKINEEAMQASADVMAMLRSQAEEVGGPAVVAANQYADSMLNLLIAQEKLTAAGQLDAETQAQINAAREGAAAAYNKQLDAINAQLTPVEQMIDDMAFELRLMGLSNIEREKEIALRYAGADATEAQRAKIKELIDQQAQARDAAEGMDVLRQATQGLFTDLMDGSKSASDAFKDMVAAIVAGISRIVAQRLTEQLFGAMGSSSGGSAGGGLAAIFASFLGGARAFGGPVSGGKLYRINEREPEFFQPDGNGKVIPLSKMPSAGGVTVNVNVAPTMERRTAMQVANMTAERISVASRNR